MTKEDIAKKYWLCRCDEIYTSRGLTAPDCPWCSASVDEAMDEWASKWKEEYENANKFIRDLAEMLGEDGSGFDCLQWSIDDFRNAMDEYAKQQAMAFSQWKCNNRWFNFENGFWYYTFEGGSSMSDATYNKHYRKTDEQLYELFLKSKQP
jgi:hypothetical protein